MGSRKKDRPGGQLGIWTVLLLAVGCRAVGHVVSIFVLMNFFWTDPKGSTFLCGMNCASRTRTVGVSHRSTGPSTSFCCCSCHLWSCFNQGGNAGHEQASKKLIDGGAQVSLSSENNFDTDPISIMQQLLNN